MATGERNNVALTVAKWAQAVRNNKEIRDEVKKHGQLNGLAVSDCAFDNSGSGITHNEYLHLRTIWYRYHQNSHIQDFAKLLKDNTKTGYKGFISPRNDERARNLVAVMSPYLKKYLEECRKRDHHAGYLHPSPDCGYYAMVRYWQVLTTTHTKGGGTGSSKIFKPHIQEDTRGRPTTPVGQQAPSGPSTVATPRRQIISSSQSPPKFETPAATSHPGAKGTAANRPSADETYVNVALLLLLQAVTQEFHKGLPELHWVPPRMALHLTVPVWNKDNKAFENKVLLEARVDGYLCDGKDGAGLERPMAICEAKSAVRHSVQVPTERQEAAEMAAWICNRPLDEGLLQRSASGRKGDRDEIYIIIGEYGTKYEQYIRNAPWKAGAKAAIPPPLNHKSEPLASDFEETLGSPAFLKQVVDQGIEEIDGWKDPEVTKALRRVSREMSAGDAPPPPPPAPSGSAAKPGISCGQLPVRPKTDQARSAGSAPGSGRTTRSAAAPLDLPSADGFLVMHRFGPWATDDPRNMEVFVRRLLALMLELHDNQPESRPSSRSSSATGGSRAPSATGNRSPARPGSRGSPS